VWICPPLGAALPAHDVRPYVRRNKTDRTDAAGLLEADRCGDIRPVPIKSPDAQGVQALHRIREQLKAQRTALINRIRGLLREFGLVIAARCQQSRIQQCSRLLKLKKRGSTENKEEPTRQRLTGESIREFLDLIFALRI
jgi:transposase